MPKSESTAHNSQGLDFPSMSHSLEVELAGELIFASDKRWIHPIFDLEIFLGQSDLKARELLVRDRIVGRAAALLLIRLGIRQVETGLLSQPGKEALDHAGVRYRYRELVPTIGCRTETLLLQVSDPDRAFALIRGLLETPPAD